MFWNGAKLQYIYIEREVGEHVFILLQLSSAT